MPRELEYADLKAVAPHHTQALAWLSILRNGATITPAVAATLWAVDEAAAARRLADLQKIGLLRAQPPGYGLDAGQQSLAARLLRDLLPGTAAAHRTLLERYRARLDLERGGQWHTLPDDGYVHQNLAWHLEQAGRAGEIHALLGEETETGCHGWHQARERLGQVEGLTMDLEQAWHLADAAVAAGDLAALGVQCRYALLASSVAGLAGDLPPSLLAALVKSQVWSAGQGLAAARRVTGTHDRAAALSHLAPYLPDDLLPDLLAAALEIEPGVEQAGVLAAVAPRLPASCLAPALAAARQLPEAQRSPALLALAGPLLATAPEAMLAAVAEIQDPKRHADLLAGMAPLLPAGLLSQVLTGVLAIRDERQRVAALAPLLPFLPEPLCRRALAATWRMRNVRARVETLVRLAPYLPAYWRGKALMAALEGLPDLPAGQAGAGQLLADMAAHLPPELQPRAVAAAEAQAEPRAQAAALLALLPHLTSELRPQAAERAMAATWLIRSETERAAQLARLAPHLPEALLDRALAVAYLLTDGRARAVALTGLGLCLRGTALAQVVAGVRSIRDETSCALALAGLAPVLSDPLAGQAELLAQALLTALALRDEKARAMALAGLAPALSPEMAGQALAAVDKIRDSRSRAMALSGLAPRLGPTDLTGLLAETQAIADPEVRVDALLSLLPFLPEPAREEAVSAAWATAADLPGEEAWGPLTARIVPHLSRPALAQLVDSVAAIDDPGRRGQALARLAPLLPPELLPQALAALPASNNRQHAQALLEIVPRLTGALRQQAVGQVLAAARGLPPGTRGRLLAELVPHLAPAEVCRALVTARLIGDQRELTQALAALVPHLPPAAAAAALEAVNDLAGAWTRDRALAALLPHLPPHLLEDALAMAWPAGEAALALARRAPQHLPRLLAAARQIGDPWSRALALLTLGVTWPAPQGGPEREAATPGEILTEALAAARQVTESHQRAQALAQLVAHLPAAIQTQVAVEGLAAIQDCPRGQEPQVLSTALARLAPHLPQERVAEAFGLAQGLAVPGRWSHLPEIDALAALAHRLPEPQVRAGLAAANGLHNLQARAGCLWAYALRLAELGCHEEALSATRPIQPVAYQVAALRQLASYLPLETLRQGLAMALDLGSHGEPALTGLVVRLAELGQDQEAWRVVLDIRGKRSRVEAIVALAPHLPAAQREGAWLLALTAAQQVQPAGDRQRVLGELARHLPAALQPAAAQAGLAAAIDRWEGAVAPPGEHTPAARRLPLRCLAAQMAGLPAEDLAACWLNGGQGSRLLHLLGRQPRAVTLAEISCLAPVLARLGGEPAVAELFEAVQQIGRWWP